MNFLLLCEGAGRLKQLEKGLTQNPDCRVTRAVSGKDAMDKITDKSLSFDLVVIDEKVEGKPGKAWVTSIVSVNPMVNTALVSSLSEEDFHEFTEGLGVLMGISPNADETEAEKMVERLSKLLTLYQNLGSQGRNVSC